MSRKSIDDPTLYSDFVKRTRHGNVKKIGTVYFCVLALVFAVTLLRENFPSEIAFLATNLMLVSGIALHAIYILQRNIDLVTEVEFQNALFTSSIAKHSDFCLIVRKDGYFAYADQGFAKTFPGFTIRERSLNNLMDAAGAARSDAERLYDAIKCSRRDWFMFTLTDTTGKTRQMILNLFPLTRPNGYFLIQGREMIERRTAGRNEKNTHSIAGPTFRYMLYLFNEMPMGAYALSPSGHVRVANRVLEKWLDFREGEIADSEMTFDDLLYKTDNEEIPDFSMQEYIGPVSLTRKNGSLFKGRLEQHVVKDGEGEVLAVIGMIRDKVEEK